MAILLTRTIVLQVWLLVYTIVVVLVAPWGMAATGLLLFSGLTMAAIRLLDRNTVHPIISDGLPTIDVQPPSITVVGDQLPRQSRTLRSEPIPEPVAASTRTVARSRGPSLVPDLSWPNSGFRNIGRGTKRG